MSWLRCIATDSGGALLDWGRPKDLWLPRPEQAGRVEVGQYCLVMVHLDREKRPVASMNLNDFIVDESTGLEDGDRVSLVIEDTTDLGVNAIVNHLFWGLLYKDELFQKVRKGQKLDGFVKLVREDKKLDLSLTAAAPRYVKADSLTDHILARLKASKGFLPLTDKTDPEVIYREFNVSKKQFKQAVGSLYKRRRITLEERGIRLVPGREGE